MMKLILLLMLSTSCLADDYFEPTYNLPDTRLDYDPSNPDTVLYTPEINQIRQLEKMNDLIEEQNRELRRERIRRMYD